MKRFSDFIVAFCLLGILSPLFVLIAWLVYRQDKGPFWYRQQRVGLNGHHFGLLKFRSMVLNADKIGSYSTQDADPRITTIGRFIRRTSLDELPQLINILNGDMSFVGPRPDVPQQRELYTEAEWIKRHSVRPGLTGLAQATLRSSATQEQRKHLDLQYVDQCGLIFDLKIICLTFIQILTKGGN